MLTRTYIEDNPFYMTLGGVPEWTSLFTEGVPQMNAYIATTAKSTATIVGESHKEDPVLAEWMYGLGRTVAFTSIRPGNGRVTWQDGMGMQTSGIRRLQDYCHLMKKSLI